ncbi:uncharacterized protein FTOL_05807 [Fusarium torulosum]|uniref:Uncharacterized protein n=1 Tax=Fusarium torulosum TaxID=33205 RepID=A0AAE8M7X5_9HYPO|nr:uncharacterized protein FTOL_05807 [Fusarium torulosum]
MALADCGCSLERYYVVFANTDSIKTEQVIKTHLKRKDTCKSVMAFLPTLEEFPSDFITTHGIAGCNLLDYSDRIHQRGLIEMAHEYLCVCGNGSVYWPDWASHPDSLQYPQDSDEIYYNIIWFFARQNKNRIGERIRSKRPQHQHQPQSTVPNIEGPTPSLDGPLAPLYVSPTDEGGGSLPSSQSILATQNTLPDAPRNEGQRIHYGQRFSPDELAQDHYSQPDAQQQHLSQVQNEPGSHNRMDLDRQPSPLPIHFAPAINRPVTTASAGTQTFDQDEQRPAREQNAPPPSSMNTNSASQESNRAHNNRINRAHPPSSNREIARSYSPPLARPPRNAHPVAECTIDFVVSYDFMPGFNVLMALDGDIFSYSLKRLFDEANWQTNFEWLLIFLQAPSTSLGVSNLCFMECVLKNNERKFQTVLRRFKQQAEYLKSCYTQLNRDAVIEVCFEPLVNGHTHSALLDAWFHHTN